MKKLSLAEASAILIGTQIGAGVLGLPYALKDTGLLGIIIVIATGLLTLLTALFVLDLAAHSDGTLSKIAEAYLGKIGGYLMFLSISVLSYGALIAYIAGSGDILSSLFGINEKTGALIFWFVMSLIVFLGLKASGEAELLLNFLLLGALTLAIALVMPKADVSNLTKIDYSAITKGIGVAVFAYVSHMVVPEMLKGLGDVKKTTKAVLIGYLVPMVFYAFFVLAFVGTFGSKTPELATSALEQLYGRLGSVLGLILPLAAISTSYIGIGLAQMDNMKEIFGIKRSHAWLLTVIPPLLVYFAGLNSFVNALWMAGTFGGLLYAGILPTVMYIKAKKIHRKLHLPIPHSFVYLSGLVFFLVFIYSILSV
ncbi:aromatic amino acid transport family protein [Thermococcus barophilus]|uniref:Aromatic amino acid permease n=1 Tax=Thermococcus barophilus (strain DSM 11836 / MP) TaxID=391623 RepID=F0LJG4_THEBM|nr:aromatic amino acid transport family protein [Thermococcus barophilus]ADT83430.1 aromatic amino acid permease [Thermococcus barophilus MP]